MTDKQKLYPKLLSEDERASLQKRAEYLLSDLLENNLGGYSGINRPFFIMAAFKEVIEEFTERDVGREWSLNALKAHPEHPKKDNNQNDR